MHLADAWMRAAGCGVRKPAHNRRLRWWLAIIVMFSGVTLASPAAPLASADDMQWVWSPAQPLEKNVPPGSCYFRKSFQVGLVESGEAQISCDNAYELYVNGRQVAEGDDWRTMKSHDITKYLTQGKNTVAVKAINKKQGSAGLVARVVVKEVGGTYVAYNTDASWRTSLQEFPQWTKHYFNDGQWLPARIIGPFGSTAPWLDEVQTAGGAPAGRRRVWRRRFDAGAHVRSGQRPVPAAGVRERAKPYERAELRRL
jgi:hypothetical protein